MNVLYEYNKKIFLSLYLVVVLFQPWCGIPPLMSDLQKPSSRRQAQQKSHISQREKEKKRWREGSQEVLNLENAWAEENWDVEQNDKGSGEKVKEDAEKDLEIKQSLTMSDEVNVKKAEPTTVSCEEQVGISKINMPLSGIETSLSSPTHRNTPQGENIGTSLSSPTHHNTPQGENIETGHLISDEVAEQLKSNSSKHNVALLQENGFYDTSGVWYPSSKPLNFHRSL